MHEGNISSHECTNEILVATNTRMKNNGYECTNEKWRNQIPVTGF